MVAVLWRNLDALPDVKEATSRFGPGRRLAWRAGSRGIAHRHADRIVGIRILVARDERLKPRSSKSHWLERHLSEPGDAEYVVELVVHAARCARDK